MTKPCGQMKSHSRTAAYPRKEAGFTAERRRNPDPRSRGENAGPEYRESARWKEADLQLKIHEI